MTFSVADFEAFCRSKPRDERYHVLDARRCPVTQFGRHIGVIGERQDLYQSPGLHRLHDPIFETLREQPKTFGALADRLSLLTVQGEG
jgi:hypothetical protein